MKNFTSIAILLISILTFANCSGNAEKKEATKAADQNVTSNTALPQGNTQVVANTAANKVGKDSDDVRPSSANSNINTKKDSDDVRGGDSDDVRKSNSNIKSANKNSSNKRIDKDDNGKLDDDDK